jgi:phosphopantetheine adenylyltransferase/dephospho-CoA kinase
MLNKKVLLLLTQSLKEIRTNLNSIVEESLGYTSESLYVYINPIASQIEPVNHTANGNKAMPTLIEDRCLLRTIVNNFYENSLRINPNVNVSCLLHNIISTANTNLYFKNTRSQIIHCDLILTDSNDQNCFDAQQFCLANILSPTSNANIGLIRLHEAKHTDKNDDNAIKPHRLINASDTDLIHTNSVFRNGIVAGTFDRLHIGHKILLSESTLLVQNKLLVGITYEQMIHKKLLYELIEPLDVRIGNVVGFLGLIAPHLIVDCVPINDPFGPSITESDYQV